MSAVTTLTPTLEFYNDNTAAWVNITSYLRDYTVAWGRRTGFESMRARTLTFTVNNQDRRFEPGYTSGAYYDGEIRQGTLINLYVTINSVAYYLFYGTVESVTVQYDLPDGGTSRARIVASDLTTIFAQDRLYVLQVNGDYADNMVKAAISEMQWSNGSHTVTNVTAAGLVLQDYYSGGQSILDIINTVADSEGFLFWVQPGNRQADCYLVDPYGAFSASGTLTGGDLNGVTLMCDSDQIATLVRVTPQNHDIGDAVYDKTGGTYESMWTLASHGLSTEQTVQFSAIGGGGEPFEPDTTYYAIVKTASIFQLATSAVNAAAGTYIEGTGDDSSGTWTVRVAGETQTASHPADGSTYGEWSIVHSGSLVPTDADALTQASKELDRRQKLFRLLRPTQLSTLVMKGTEWDTVKMGLTVPFYALTVNLNMLGTPRSFDLRVQGGVISHRVGEPLLITAYTEAASQWET